MEDISIVLRPETGTRPSPGWKFEPTLQDLLGYYLYNHIRRALPVEHYSTIHREDLYGEEEPWDLWLRRHSGGEPALYVFTELKQKRNPDGSKPGYFDFDWAVGKNGGKWNCQSVFPFRVDGDGDTSAPPLRDENLVPGLNTAGPNWVPNWVLGFKKEYVYEGNDVFLSEEGKWHMEEYSLAIGRKLQQTYNKVLCVLRHHNSPLVARRKKETDCLERCRALLSKLLSNLNILPGDGNLFIREKVDGEAYVNIRKGKIIPLSVALSWEGEVKDADGKSVLKVDGTVDIPSISDENAEEDPEIRVTVRDDGPVGRRLKEAMAAKGKTVIEEKDELEAKKVTPKVQSAGKKEFAGTAAAAPVVD